MSADTDAHAQDIQRLRRLLQGQTEKTHALSRAVEKLEQRIDAASNSGGGAQTTYERAVEACWTSIDAEGSKIGGIGSDDGASSDLKRGMRATHETLVTFADGGALTVRAASTRADYLNNADEFESRPVTLEKVKYAKTLTRGREGVRVRASVVPFGAEGVDAVSGGVFGGSRRGHQLTGFGADGGDLIGRCHTDSMGALAVEFNPHTALHVGVFTGNRQPEDGRGKVLAQLTTKKTSSTKHTNVAINASRSQDGETLVGVALTFAKTLPKTTRAIVASAWGSMSPTRGGKSREDYTEWGVAATLPPTTGASVVKNSGYGVVIGKPANRGGVQAEAFLRIGGDGEEPGATLVPGVVLSVDDRGRRETAFACRAHWLW